MFLRPSKLWDQYLIRFAISFHLALYEKRREKGLQRRLEKDHKNDVDEKKSINKLKWRIRRKCFFGSGG